ncbi:hypothetical protein ACJD0Z_07800 [Flavobacteriaceae bacterium M23B6Z8]
MKTIYLKGFLLLIFCLLSLQSCGPVVIAHRADMPPPPWFYPNRIETVRYVYFPNYSIYYDLSLRMYIYYDNNRWIRVKTLPSRYRNINLRRARYRRINNYYDDNIKRYHENQNSRGRSNQSIQKRRRN